jgi:hypothetical protein
MNMAELTNLGLWSSGSRIFAGYRMAILGQNGAVPPDVATVVTVLQQREQSRFGEFVGTLRTFDAEINEAYRQQRKRDMPIVPPGQSVLDPIYNQHLLLQGTPSIQDEWIWHDMPPELYVVNDPNISSEERAILQDLMPEYAMSATKAAAGEKVFVADPMLIASAESIRKDLLPGVSGFGVTKFAAAPVIQIARVIGPMVLWGLGIIFAGSIIVNWLKGRAAVQAQENASRELAAKIAQNQAKIELTRRLFDYCMDRAETGTSTLMDCNKIREQLGGLEPLETPAGLPSGGCGFGSCWPWAIAGAGVGVLVGYTVAKRYGLVPKE